MAFLLLRRVDIKVVDYEIRVEVLFGEYII
jgi:hypothetical protein